MDEIINEEITDETSDEITFEDLGLDEYALRAVAKKGLLLPRLFKCLQFHVF